MDDALLMGRLQSGTYLNSNVQQLIERERLVTTDAAGQAITQGLALQQLHHDEGLAFVLLDFVDGADIGMIQRGSGLRLALEAL